MILRAVRKPTTVRCTSACRRGLIDVNHAQMQERGGYGNEALIRSEGPLPSTVVSRRNTTSFFGARSQCAGLFCHRTDQCEAHLHNRSSSFADEASIDSSASCVSVASGELCEKSSIHRALRRQYLAVRIAFMGREGVFLRTFSTSETTSPVATPAIALDWYACCEGVAVTEMRGEEVVWPLCDVGVASAVRVQG